jgi:hypothetical protein
MRYLTTAGSFICSAVISESKRAILRASPYSKLPPHSPGHSTELRRKIISLVTYDFYKSLILLQKDDERRQSTVRSTLEVPVKRSQYEGFLNFLDNWEKYLAIASYDAGTENCFVLEKSIVRAWARVRLSPFPSSFPLLSFLFFPCFPIPSHQGLVEEELKDTSNDYEQFILFQLRILTRHSVQVLHVVTSCPTRRHWELGGRGNTAPTLSWSRC